MDEIIGLFTSPATSISPASSTMEKELATEHADGPGTIKEGKMSSLEALPAEIIYHILAYLPYATLAELSRTSRLLRSHAHNDLLWLGLVRAYAPNGGRLELPSASKSWRRLYLAHHPYWFLARHKVWFADVRDTGKITLARYNPKTGCLEAYQLIAEHGSHTFELWSHDPGVIIHTFNPTIRLWTDDPVVMLDPKQGSPEKCLQKEVAMQTGSPFGIRSTISLCQPIPLELQDHSMGLWPPFLIPAEQRVRNESINKFRSEAHRPRSLDLMSDQTFRVRKWPEFSNTMQPRSSNRWGEEVMTFGTLPEESYTPTKEKPYQGIWVGDYSGHGCEFLLVLQREVSSGIAITRKSETEFMPEGVSIARLEEETAEERDAGIRLIFEDEVITPESEQNPVVAGPSTEDPERMNEPENNYAGISSSKKPATEITGSDQGAHTLDTDDEVFGRLEAIKLTGDVNVPRGQITWMAEDIGPKGLLRIGKEQMFTGAKMVKSWGRIAGAGFRHDRFIPSQLILMSHDTIAQYWEVSESFNHWFAGSSANLAIGLWSYLFLQTDQHR